jgi:hypothetical protein
VDFIDGSLGFAAGTDGVIVRTTDAGGSWTAVGSGQNRTLYRIAGSARSNLTAVGDSGTVLSSEDGGNTWRSVFAATSYNLYSIVAFGDSVRMACGDYGTILRTIPERTSGAPLHGPTGNDVPFRASLWQNYPNPFNPATVIEYTISGNGTRTMLPVRLDVFDLLGREVTVLVDGWQAPGRYRVRFDADGPAGGLASGIYIYRLCAGTQVVTHSMLLLR